MEIDQEEIIYAITFKDTFTRPSNGG